MNVLGELALWIALPVSLWGMVLGFSGGRKQRGDLTLSAERSVYAVFFLTIVASLGVVDTFLNDRFEYWYVANYSSISLPTFYKVSGLWAGQRGSLLFWLLLLSLFSTIAVWSNRRKNREFMPYVAGTLLTITSFFLVVLLFADVNPFEKLGFTPADGAGLNPQLQNYWMTIHPPTLYLGFTAFTIPFAFAIAALLNGRLDSRWIVLTRKWTLLSWFFLANGIIFGMRWAYEELGWGGYWFWDPVENASLLPWLTATAFLHSIMIQENRGMLKIWNMGLVILTFLLTIFATFLTRSGLIESVHTFATELKIAFIFLGFMATILMVGLVLVLYRLPSLKSENQIESFVSREAAFVFNNLILLGATFAVLWGTLLPLISEGFTGQEIAVGPPFFNRVNLPIGLALLALMGIGPVIAWRRASKRNLKKNFVWPLGVGVLTAAALWIAGARHGMALLTFGISAFVMTIIVVEFWKGTRARARIEGEGVAKAFYHLIARNRRRWGGYIVHVGVVLIFTAFAAAPWYGEFLQTLEPGETMVAESPLGHTYEMTYEGMSTNVRDPDKNLQWQAVALVSVRRDGEPLGTFTTEKRRYIRPEAQIVTEVGIKQFPMEDLYIILADADLERILQGDAGGQAVTFNVLVKPLIAWIWAGGLILTFGSLISMWPSAERVKTPSSSRGRAGATGAEPLPAGD
ncbi:MAG: heme lyase CcmF/NrfE family subunit [Gemmatimonadetes bacterium]|nr:heme lyase CcmF/NrfE family subunit [Gemmatimonadota bacterium]